MPVTPAPVIELYMDHPELLEGVAVSCTASAFSVIDGSAVPLLNSPTKGYQNDQGNWSLVTLEGLNIDAAPGAIVELSVRCNRAHEELPAENWVLELSLPSLEWSHRPGPAITSGEPFMMTAMLTVPHSPAGNKSECTATVVGNEAFIRGGVTAVAQGVALWEDIVLIGPLDSDQTLRVNCSTGFHRIPQVLTAPVHIQTCRAGAEPAAGFTSCASCTGNTYSPGGLHPCRSCPPGLGAACSSGELILHPGFYPASSAYLSSRTEGGQTANPVPPEPMTGSTILYPCDVVAACDVHNASAGYYCTPGYEGPLCGACAKGFSKVGLYCQECWPKWLSILAVLLLAVVGILLLAYIALLRRSSTPSQTKIIFRIFLTYIQMLSSLGQFRAKATEMVQQILGVADTVGNSVFSAGPVYCTFRLEYYSRFVFSISLPFIVGALVIAIATIGLVWERLCKARRNRNRRDGKRIRRPRTHLSPPMASPDGHRDQLRLIKADIRKYFKKKTYLGPMLFVYFLFYNSIINTLASIFRCREEVIDDRRYLEVDLGVECFTGQHVTGMVAAAILALLLNVLFPLVLVVVLRRNKQRLHTETMQRRYGFLYMGYSIERGLYWWEAVVLLRKFAVLMVASSISDPFYQSLLGVSILVVFLVAQVNFRPYTNTLLNRLELLVMSSLCLTQVVSLAYFRTAAMSLPESQQQHIDTAVTLCLCFVNALCVLVLGLSMWRAARQQQKEKQRERVRQALTPSGPKVKEPWSRLHQGLGGPQQGMLDSDQAVEDAAGSASMVWNYPWQWKHRQQYMPGIGRSSGMPPGKDAKLNAFGAGHKRGPGSRAADMR